MNRNLKLTLFAVLFTLSLSAQQIVLQNIGIPLSAKDSTRIVQMAGFELDFYSQTAPVEEATIRLRLFKNSDDYKAFMRSRGTASIMDLSGGLYNDNNRELWVPKNSNYLNVVYHEMSHYFFARVFRSAPGWLNEGLAKYFEHSKIRKNQLTHSLNDEEPLYIKSMLQLKELNLKELVSIQSRDVARKSLTNDGFIHKAGYCIVYLMMDKHPSEFRDILQKIRKGMNSYDAIDTTYPGGFSQFNTDFGQFYGNL